MDSKLKLKKIKKYSTFDELKNSDSHAFDKEKAKKKHLAFLNFIKEINSQKPKNTIILPLNKK